MTLTGLVALTAGAGVACGGISDPDRPAQTSETTRTITGKLTGASAPAGARVALVWSTKGTSRVVLGADAPIVGNTFTMTLTFPPDDAFFRPEADSRSGDAPAPMPVPDAPPSTGTGGTGGAGGAAGLPSSASLRPLDQSATGTVVSSQLEGAFGGFVIYVDTNGNGKLDIAANASLSTTDTVVGGNRTLVLAALRGGGQLAYEKLRDESGVLPQPGFNLMWTEKERWLPLSSLELGLASSDQGLPYGVCSAPGDSIEEGGSGGAAPLPSGTEPSPGSTGGSPPSNVICAPDGRSYTYKPVECNPTPPEPPGLCSGTAPESRCTSVPSMVNTLPNGPVPSWWPCPVTEPLDGGAPDGGEGDGGIDAGKAP